MTVPRGHMVLHDRIDPPLVQGRYEVEVETTLTVPEYDEAPLDPETRFFEVRGPRFRLPPAEVAGVFPPRNARGPFLDALPHVALYRRTLPWERPLDPTGVLPAAPARRPDDPPAPTGTPPWMALLLLEEAEILELGTDAAVGDVVPPTIATNLGVGDDDRCAFIAVSPTLARELLPTVEELHLLTHVREVNVDDRELAAGDSDGFFAVVMGNRIPEPGRRYRACLVSVEGRTDVLRSDEPAVEARDDGLVAPVIVAEAVRALTVTDAIVARDLPGAIFVPVRPAVEPVKLVLLHSWTFECEGSATFEGLCLGLDVGMFGEVRGEWPKVTDTGHLPIELHDRAGATQTAWYRGPLAPFPVSRDDRGPYHSADQCRRVSPETGMEDLTYAAAFEVGRLLAASDGRLAQELMRWRRVDYRRSVEGSVFRHLRERMPALPDRAELLLAGLAATLVRPWLDPGIPRVDPFEWDRVAGAPGLRPDRLAEAWGLDRDVAAGLLAAGPDVLAPSIAPDRADRRPQGAIDEVRADLGALQRLVAARKAVVEAGLRDGITHRRTR